MDMISDNPNEALARAMLFGVDGISEAQVLKSWGSYFNFMISYGLKPWNPDDVEEAKQILLLMKAGDEAAEEEEEKLKKKGAGNSSSSPSTNTLTKKRRVCTMLLDEGELDRTAKECGWTKVNGDKGTFMVAYVKEDKRLNFWMSTGTVGSYLWHPKKPKKKRTQLFRREVRMGDVKGLFLNPRKHTGKGYHEKKERRVGSSSKVSETSFASPPRSPVGAPAVDSSAQNGTVVHISGSLLDSDTQFVVHQTNCRHKPPGLGLAKHIFQKWPHSDVYSSRAPWVKGTQYDKPGSLAIRGAGFGPTPACKAGRGVINLFGQDWQGKKEKAAASWEESRRMRLGWFEQGVREISRIPALTSVAFPFKIGCNLAGGDWGAYLRVLGDLAAACPGVRVVVYKLPDSAERSFKASIEKDRWLERSRKSRNGGGGGKRRHRRRGRGRGGVGG
eukprot:g2917.t1